MSTTQKTQKPKAGRSAIADVVAREYTIHLHKRVHGVSFKKRAPRAIKEIKAFAENAMVSSDPFCPIQCVFRACAGSSKHNAQAQNTCDTLLQPQPLTASLHQGTRDVRLDPQLNKKVWECGVKGVPFRLRVRISRKRNDEEGAKEKLYSYVQAVNVKDPKGLQTTVVEDA
ncbi:hypothetical protein E4T48_06412 [Aureobasidium sp. EXF-10727]|nr:hypothetical protein E4T48_06412 [Aureobasidium sp. EXF-10727]KAI4725271.1 hypothetical protein E4T49_06993 [Aureobasidium sp. EXF-10728]